MWSTLVGEYVGHDYLGRMIHMKPMSRYTFVPGPGNGTWNLTAKINPREGEGKAAGAEEKRAGGVDNPAGAEGKPAGGA